MIWLGDYGTGIPTQKKDYSQENINKFKECLGSLSWSEVYEEKNLNSAFNKFHDLILLFYDLCFPIIRVKMTANIMKPKWMTKGLKVSSIYKRKLRYKYYKTNNNDTKALYKKYDTLLKACVVTSKKQTNTKILQTAKNICKTTWDIIQNKLDDTKINVGIQSITTNNKTLHNPLDIAETFNEYLTNLTNIKNTLPKHQPRISNKNTLNSLYLKPCSEEEIIKHVKALKNTTAVGFDGVATKIIKTCIKEMAGILTYIVNLSLEQGCFPERLKQSIVKPLLKI